MECNKDEAIRAKEIAEKKMVNKDYEGARKIALRAKNLYPELDNITQMLCICDVHCSAQKGLLGSEKDWYGILQIEKLADEPTVKKQYRRLALNLHPDKNRFPGAESAFKLICEANALLTDTTKKSLYDCKVRGSARSASLNPSNHLSKNPQLNKQYSAGNDISNGDSSLNQHEVTQSTRKEVFWTSCPFCKTRYQYHRDFVQKTLCCPTCKKAFVAYEVIVHKSGPPGAQHVPMKPDSSRPAAFHEKLVPNRGNCKPGAKKGKKGPPASSATASKRTVPAEPDVKTGIGSESIKVAGASEDIENMKIKEADNENTFKSLHREKEGGTSNGGTTFRKSTKRSRKESSESCDTLSDSDVEDVVIGDFATDLKFESSHVRPTRRLSRKRQNVSYNETEVDDLASTINRPQSTKTNSMDVQKDAVDGEDLKNCFQNSFPTDSTKESLHDNEKDAEFDEKHKGGGGGETGGKSGNEFDTVEIESDSDEDIFSSGEFEIDCPDPEFSDFEKKREESQFDVNQFWACYDNNFDGMPRFYAKVKKVFSSPFGLSITWLEAVPTDESCQKWVDEELPVGCGSFKLGTTEKTDARLSFSHQVHFEKGKKRGSLFMYPREGEVWALFKDWDVSWSSEPDNHKEFKYEIVEVLSDFVPGFGVRVVYLDKVTGFVSLFERACQGENGLFVIRPDEVYKFSHGIPCFKMTGSERDGVPIGSFELDPASLPLNADYLYNPRKTKMEDITNGS
ncbi:hypothetical protein OROHE_013044 [Orobanche hederae]